MFQNLIARIKPSEHARSSALFHLILVARKPLSPLEVCAALGFFKDEPPKSILAREQSVDGVTSEDAERKRIQAFSCGLMSTSSWPAGGSVDFIHSTVRDYGQYGGFSALTGTPGETCPSPCHQTMAIVCANVLSVEELKSGVHDSELVSKYYGFCVLTVSSLSVDLQEIEITGLSTNSLLETLSSTRLALWARIRRSLTAWATSTTRSLFDKS
jgi:hypothetical protein